MVAQLKVMVASMVIAAATTVYGQDLVPDGPGFQIDTATTRVEESPAVRIDPSGGFVVVWESHTNKEIFGRRFGSSGEPLGNEFRINRTTFGPQSEASVCQDASGGFVVVWQSSRQDGDGNGIFGQRFSPTGKRIGGEFRVNTNARGDQRDPSIACDAQGNFVVVWTNDMIRIRAQRFRRTGVRIGSEFSIGRSAALFNFQVASPSVCSTPTGAFIVAWSEPDPSDQAVVARAQRFDRQGKRVGPATVLTKQFLVTQVGLSSSSISCNADGQFAVAWNAPALHGIGAAVVDATGQKLGDIFLQKESAEGGAVAIDAVGNTFLTWTQFIVGEQALHVYGQFFTPDGGLLGSEFQLDDLSPLDGPEIALSPEGRLVAVWKGTTQVDSQAIVGRLFQVDGF